MPGLPHAPQVERTDPGYPHHPLPGSDGQVQLKTSSSGSLLPSSLARCQKPWPQEWAEDPFSVLGCYVCRGQSQTPAHALAVKLIISRGSPHPQPVHLASIWQVAEVRKAPGRTQARIDTFNIDSLVLIIWQIAQRSF